MANISPFIVPVYGYDIDLNKKTINKVALIDADRYKHVVTYRIYQKMMQDGEIHNTSLLNDTIDDYLSNDIFDRFEADAYIFCFSAPSSKVFRNYIAQDKKYKGNRKVDDPYFYTDKFDDMAYVFEYINQRYTTLFFDDLEADDILSMLQNEHTFIFSHDKDLKQVPGLHWDMDKYDLFNVSEEEGLRTLMIQILTGDSTDNISGLAGFGAKSAEKIVDEDINSEAIFYRAIKLYTDKYGLLEGIDTFVEMWSLVSMKIDRGNYLKEKYKRAFMVRNSLINDEQS